MNRLINSRQKSYKLQPQILYYLYKSGKIVGYKNINKINKVTIIQFYDLTRIWILSHELKYFMKYINK